MAVIGIIVFCGGIICAVAWLLNRAERPKDPEEDREQEEYLTEWSRNHGKNEKSKVEKYRRAQRLYPCRMLWLWLSG